MANTTNKRGRGRPPKGQSASTSKKKQTKSSEKKESEGLFTPAMKKFLVGAVLVGISLFVLFSIVTASTGIIGNTVKDVLCGNLGLVGGIACALALFYLGINCIKKDSRYSIALYTAACVVSVLCVSALYHCLLSPSISATGAAGVLYTTGILGKSGGIVGGFIAMGMNYLFGRLSTSVILTVLLLCSMVILSQFTPYMLYATVIENAKKTQETFRDKKEVRATKRAQQQSYIQQQRLLEEEAQALIEHNRTKTKVDIALPSTPMPLGDMTLPSQESLDGTPVAEQVANALGVEGLVEPIILEESPPISAKCPPVSPPAPLNFPITVYNWDTSIPQDEFPTDEDEPVPSIKEILPTAPDGLVVDAFIEPTYCYPPITLLKKDVKEQNADVSGELQENAIKLIDTLKSFGVEATILNISRGPAVTRYELSPKAGTKVSKIVNLADDIALNLAANGIRIEAPIPGKPAVGIEVPNQSIDAILLRTIIDTPAFKNSPSKVSAALGSDISGNPIIADLSKMPHMLIAGSTGSGKSVCINTIITSILYKASPEEVKLLMVDPKVVELGVYNGIPHLLIPVVTDPKKAAGALNWAVMEMLNRYKLFAESNVRDMKGYNAHVREVGEGEVLPQIVIIIDELADLMMAAPGDVEDAICRLAQMARAAGMHLVIATQRPSVDVITGVIKANIPSRISFAVSSAIDSRTILDGSGAEKLLGRGDMLYYPTGMSKPLRVQGCFVSDKEVENIVDFIKKSKTAMYNEKIMAEIEKNVPQGKGKGKPDKTEGGGFDSDDDTMLHPAIEVVVEAGQASVSLLQRRLKLGYARAARIVDEMEERGIVGPYEGSKPRPVLISKQEWMEMKLRQSE